MVVPTLTSSLPAFAGVIATRSAITIPVGGKLSASININRRRRLMNKNFTAFRKENVEQVIRELQKTCQELQEAVLELQELQIASRSVDSDGTPKHGSACELFNGQYIRLTQLEIGPIIVAVEHGLSRVPQGAIFIQATAHNRVFIAGDTVLNVPPANERAVSIQLNGDSANDEHTLILF